jgi:hypothetical protein
MQNIIVLSTKSAGSTALQSYFIKNFGFSKVAFTPHHEGETLYWTKVASILDLHQDPMYRSIVPYPKEIAVNELNKFLYSNLGVNLEGLSKAEAISKYYQLINKFGPKFIEKSPHHLYNRSNLELIIECYNKLISEVHFNVIGLIRHPHDVIYSAWKRWGYNCSQFENEWLQSYNNLLWLKEQIPVTLVKYEDMVSNRIDFVKTFNLTQSTDEFKFRDLSIKKWKNDMTYGHQLSTASKNTAAVLGYDDFVNDYSFIRWECSKLKASLKSVIRNI